MVANPPTAKDLSPSEGILEKATKWSKHIKRSRGSNHNDNNEADEPNEDNDIEDKAPRLSTDSFISTEESSPTTPVTPKFASVKLPSEIFDCHKQDRTPFHVQPRPDQHVIGIEPQSPHTKPSVKTPDRVGLKKQVILLQTPKKQINGSSTRNNGCTTQASQQLKTPPNSKLRRQVRQPLVAPQAIILRPTTFWRHHPLSPHSLPVHSPSSRLIRRSALIASPTIGIQHPDPDQETTRICVGLAGVDLDSNTRSRRLSLLPI
ncbi:uncharacterized protein I303_101663 [Kwoniella dejecticola CBS 10117]|uniref:Uncharacterized protein n=1 Tax=Kwoniella dejecticola CBS 10117 TaxID=1296121 RepID=A0AAJ8KK36_9TREE